MHRGADIDLVGEGSELTPPGTLTVLMNWVPRYCANRSTTPPLGSVATGHSAPTVKVMPVRTALSVTENIPDVPLTLVPDSATPTLPVKCGS